jgi:hypothetical protein
LCGKLTSLLRTPVCKRRDRNGAAQKLVHSSVSPCVQHTQTLILAYPHT